MTEGAINTNKCELYGSKEPVDGLNIPVISNPDIWSYLGTPLKEQTAAAVQSADKRAKQATDAIARFAVKYPAQALLLLRATAGACKVEYLMQSLSGSTITDQLARETSADFRKAFDAIVQGEGANENVWI